MNAYNDPADDILRVDEILPRLVGVKVSGLSGKFVWLSRLRIRTTDTSIAERRQQEPASCEFMAKAALAKLLTSSEWQSSAEKWLRLPQNGLHEASLETYRSLVSMDWVAPGKRPRSHSHLSAEEMQAWR
jgi:hypothetical protein